MGRGEVLVKAMPWVPLLFIWVLAVCVLVILPVTVPWWFAVIIVATTVAVTILVVYFEVYGVRPRVKRRWMQ